MKTYDLYVNSGPMRKKTYIHVPSLRGCNLLRDTADEAIAATPDAIRLYLAYLRGRGEKVDPDTPFRVRVAEERLRGGFLGSEFYEPDATPLTKPESARAMKWLGWIRGDLRGLAQPLGSKKLSSKPATGRSITQILRHLCNAYLRGVPGSSHISRLANEGKLDPFDALDQLQELETERLRTMSDFERAEVRQTATGWSANYASRRMLEHAWEHYLEICARLNTAP
jgi:predicted RNase H-like HicB family nuclease